jgi:hypothetical protein
MASLYDPLHVLRVEFHTTPIVSEQGGIVLRFEGAVSAEHKENARVVARAYEKLLRLQLETGGASVRKLMARGKIRLEGGRYVLG